MNFEAMNGLIKKRPWPVFGDGQTEEEFVNPKRATGSSPTSTGHFGGDGNRLLV